jgi:hypothetical protein
MSFAGQLPANSPGIEDALHAVVCGEIEVAMPQHEARGL